LAEFRELCRQYGLVVRRESKMFRQYQQARSTFGLPQLGLDDFREELREAGMWQAREFWLSDQRFDDDEDEEDDEE
jgi:hypothetical protein